MLTRLIYASEATERFGPDDLEALLAVARAANARRNITGMLAFDRRAFLQVLEGRREQVSEVFCRIAGDPRHQRIVILDTQPIDERLFPHWTMGFAAADAQGRELFQRFGGSDQFEPHTMTAASALGLLRVLSGR